MATLTREQMASHFANAGFQGSDLANMVGIAWRESRGKSDAHRTDQPKSKLSGDLGLTQINYTNWPTVQRALGLTSKSQLFDPATNARAAKVLYDRSGFQPWTAAKGGWSANGNPLYGVDMGAANAAVQRYNAAPQQYGRNTSAATANTSTSSGTKNATPQRNTEYDPTYQPPPVDPEAQGALTDFLSGFGVDYPDAPRADSQLLGFMRGLQQSSANAEDLYESTTERIEGRGADTTQDIARADRRSREGITADSQNRNVLSSGATNSRFARQAEDRSAADADNERRTADSLAEAGNAYSTFQDSQRQRALEQTLSTETQQATKEAASKAQIEAYKRQQAESDFQFERNRAAQDDYYGQLAGMYR